jgi:hypothetical protein
VLIGVTNLSLVPLESSWSKDYFGVNQKKMSITKIVVLSMTLWTFLRHWFDVSAQSSEYYNVVMDLRSRESVVAKVPPGGGLSVMNVTVQMDFVRVISVDDTTQVCNTAAISSINQSFVQSINQSINQPINQFLCLQYADTFAYTVAEVSLAGDRTQDLMITGPCLYLYNTNKRIITLPVVTCTTSITGA